MEPFIEDLINNPKVPKWLGFVIMVIMAVVCGLLIFLGVLLEINSSELVGRIFGGIMCALFVALVVYLFAKIARCKQNDEER